MIPIVAALVHQVAQKAIAKHVNQAFSAKAKQHAQPVVLPHLELERVEPSRAELHRAPAEEIARRLHESVADGARAAQKLADDRSAAAQVQPDELQALQSQASQLSDQVEQLSQDVGKALSQLKATI